MGFDGHFGVHRVLQKGIDVRSKRTVGRPKKVKYLEVEVRTASCKAKGKICGLVGGWLFVVDCRIGNGNVIAGHELINNENLEDKLKVVSSVLSKPGASAVRTIVHDDCCHFKPYALKNAPEQYRKIVTWLIDKWHRRNHVATCSLKNEKKADMNVERQLNTSRAEQFNSYIRRSNFFLNSLNVASHRFWVHCLMRHFNKDVRKVSKFGRGRRNARARNMKR